MDSIHTKVICTVKSSLAHAFSQLWRKAYSPQDFIQGIESLNIIEKTDEVIIRSMSMKGMTIKQRITKDEINGLVIFHNLEDSSIQGDIFNQVVPSSQGKQHEVQLSFFSNAKNSKGDQFPSKDIFQKALQKTKEVIQTTAKN